MAEYSNPPLSLLAQSPVDGLLPVATDRCELFAHPPTSLVSFAPYEGQEKQASEALKSGFGMALPAPGRATGKEGTRAIWSGRGQYFLLGLSRPETLADFGALTDQSDAWAVMRLKGLDAPATLARLVPLDLDATRFKRGHTARTLLEHMMLSLTCTGPNQYDLMIMRSFAKTGVHDLTRAMRSVAARA